MSSAMRYRGWRSRRRCRAKRLRIEARSRNAIAAALVLPVRAGGERRSGVAVAPAVSVPSP
jgi:hypothetical protein